jgi:hypothetical protein
VSDVVGFILRVLYKRYIKEIGACGQSREHGINVLFCNGFPMKFHHLVEINDPLNPLIEPLTRKQLWQGLVMRAELPKVFIPWLDSCTVTDRSSDGFARELHFGKLVVRDHVTFFPMDRILYEIPAQKDIAQSCLAVSIEEPQPDLLFVRFEYDDGTGDNEEAMYRELRRSAYEEADIDTIRIIRQLAEQGRFDASLN